MIKWIPRLVSALVAAAAVSAPRPAACGPGDAVIWYDLALAADGEGDAERAYALFRRSCLAFDGLAAACLEWADRAAKREDEDAVKQALASAVMLEPGNIEARFELAAFLIGKKDHTWAIEHLKAALKYSQDTAQRAVLSYYLGYAQLEAGLEDEARATLKGACCRLGGELETRCLFFRGLLAKNGGDRAAAHEHWSFAARNSGSDWGRAAGRRLRALHRFIWPDGLSAQVRAALALNTYPVSAFLEEADIETPSALQTTLRADVIWGYTGPDEGLSAVGTVYREQSLAELGGASSDSPFSASDFNLTLFMVQAAYVRRVLAGAAEHEVRLGLDGELQFLDRPPVKSVSGQWTPSQDAFGLLALAVGPKLWWSVASSDETVTALRLKLEARPNELERDRSTLRMRARLVHDRKFSPHWSTRLLTGLRYDRAYWRPDIIKYDRLLPEGQASLTWQTPWRRLSATAHALFRYNWYLNARGDKENSFRPAWLDVPSLSKEQNAAARDDYFRLTRRDLEWEVGVELLARLWPGGKLAVIYRYHERQSNIDDAPVPSFAGVSVPSPSYGYDQHWLAAELRHVF